MSNFTFTKIDVPAAAGTYVYISVDGVDAAGEAVGNYGNVDGEGDGTFHGLVTSDNTGITFDPPGSTNTDVVGITSTGEIFGDYVDNVLKQHGFVDNNGTVTLVDMFLANSTTISGVNDAGVIYGEYADNTNHVHGFIDNGGTFSVIDVPGSTSTSISGVNASGLVVGTFTDAGSVVHGFVESNNIFNNVDPPGSIFTSVVGVSNASVIVGNYQDSGNIQHGFVETFGAYTTISIPGATTTSITAINASGEIVGNWTDSAGNVHGFVDQGGVISTVDVPGATETNILGVSASGEITGYYNDTSGDQHGFVGKPGPTVIESFGSTSLVQVGSNYYLDNISSGTGPELQYQGAPVTANQFGTVAPIAAEQTASGYDLAWKIPGTNQYEVWTTDSSGNFIANITGLVSGNSIALESLETTFHQDLNNDGTIGVTGSVIESSGSTRLMQVGSNYYLENISSGTGVELQFQGAPVTAGQFSAVPIGAEQTTSGYDLAWKLSGTNQYEVWTTDSNGNFLANITGVVSGNSAVLESLETTFHQDLNGDGTIGVPTVTIEAFGSTSLVQVGSNYYLDNISSGTGPELQYQGAPVTANQFGTVAPIAAEQTASGYDLAWKIPGTNQYEVWTTDSSGNFIANITGLVSGNSIALESLETTFHQDLNNDGTIGVTGSVIESSGSTRLMQVGSNYYLENISSGTGVELQFQGAPVTAGQFSAVPIGAEQTTSGYDLAWKLSGTNQYEVWTTDSNGNFIANITGVVSGNSAVLESLETTFHQDLNGDGTIGVPTVTIEAFGSTSLVQVGSNYYLDNISSGTGPELQYQGAPVTANQFGTVAPIAAEQTASGYDLAWKIPGTNQYEVWTTDSSGNFIANITGVVSGNSVALESLETTFHQDLNNDGTIGVTGSVIESSGSTRLMQVGSNYYLENISSGTGVELQFQGAPVTAGQFSAVPIGAEQTTSGYDLAWKLSGTNQYEVWTTDSNGNFLANITGVVSGNSAVLESLETTFHQDFNGDGAIGIPGTIATGGTLELTVPDSMSVHFSGPTGSLILDHSSGFDGQITGFSGTGTLSSSDQIDLRDIGFGTGTTFAYAGNSTGGTLTVTDAQDHTANIPLVGNYTGSTFSLSSDGSGGTIVIDPPVKQDLASGTVSFNDPAPTDKETVTVSPQNGGAGYIGNFTVDAATTANGQDSAAWHFNFDSSPVAATITQSYDITVADHHADGTNSAVAQSVTVTIAGAGNDGFVFHPGVGADTIVNAASTDTIELDGFSSVTSNHQLASLLAEAQAGISQPLFQAANGGHDTVINLGNHDVITLINVPLSALHASDFIVH